VFDPEAKFEIERLNLMRAGRPRRPIRRVMAVRPRREVRMALLITPAHR
jgi:hypothetical protein